MIEVAIRHRFAAPASRGTAARAADDEPFDIDVAFASSARALALFGDSGAGKTTLLDCIAGLRQPQAGRIALDGRVLFDSAGRVNVATVRRRVGYVFQDGRLFPHLRVRANLIYGATAGVARGEEFARIVDLLELGSLLERRPDMLSGGERQRVAIGRALLSSPQVLLLDEPLTGLHRAAREQVLDDLRRMKAALPLAMILVSHQPDEVLALADEVVELHGGRAAAPVDVEVFRHVHGPHAR
jgi:molybdate transport system ATP-binding protein